MLIVHTRVLPSPIQGLGLFADEDIAEGQPVWRFELKFDQLVDIDDVRGMPAAFRHFFDTYCYESHDFPGRYVLGCDHAKFINHSEDPNIVARGTTSYAARAIKAGEEITTDYRASLANWPGFDAPPVPT